MSNVTNLNVEVSNLTKYGFQTTNGEYVNWSKNCVDQAKIVPGGEYEMVIFVADSGKKYVNSVVGKVEKKMATPKTSVEVVTPAAKPDVERAKKFTPKFNKAAAPDNSMSKDEWAAKDRRISRQGCIQVAVQVVSDFEQAAELADKMLAYVNRG